LVELKKSTPVLAAGDRGADIFRIKSNADSAVFAFTRKNESQALFAIFNLSANQQIATLTGNDYAGTYTNVMTGEKFVFQGGEEISLKPWEFYIYCN
ncbi:MAG TPA: alpha-glucosidase C-terminal domain-containing protein, partial [Tenuifilaceae bacterium]|nr:alpha-glucosidase C-terminal domain-containing protein [Tenuifilaceae bacterium]